MERERKIKRVKEREKKRGETGVCLMFHFYNEVNL